MRAVLFIFIFSVSLQASAENKTLEGYLGRITNINSTQDQDSTEAGVKEYCSNCGVGLFDNTNPTAHNTGNRETSPAAKK